MPDKARLAIIGGMGPAASVELHKSIVRLSTSQSDQDHFDIVHFSFPSAISDRTEYLLGQTMQCPSEGIIPQIDLAISVGATHICIPCNTCHSGRIWGKLERYIAINNQSVVLINMMHCLRDYCLENLNGGQVIGVLATNGTVKTGVIAEALEPSDFSVIYPQTYQADVQDSIYNKDWGIKSSSEDLAIIKAKVKPAIKYLVDQGAVAVILGCTELPLAITSEDCVDTALLDPSAIMAAYINRVLISSH